MSYCNKNGQTAATHINVDESCKKERSHTYHNAYYIIPLETNKQKTGKTKYQIEFRKAINFCKKGSKS